MRSLRIDLDQHLLAAAADIMGTADSNATVNEALRRIVVHERQLRNLERLMADSIFSTQRDAAHGSASDPDSIFSTKPEDDPDRALGAESVAER
ncbi:type II toxin-antitoxin system VapB family antitoxin [Nocardia asteroides]|uniref:type II toxin-antitoxin system VapB family antitoxin n=1 Tax=Nocardia asteroides TaxID=1824 RepID=UPI001E64BA66|nr:type II toxin-antitoxin system VapB family antitoxin [Nocardia asteroides]UGT53632.1 hypothetical protein LTT85_23515 [Nocardia asteroides]